MGLGLARAEWEIRSAIRDGAQSTTRSYYGQADTARRYFTEAASGAGTGFVSPYQLAIGYAFLGDKNRALSYLEKSADAKEGQVLYIKYDSAFDSLHSAPRFLALETNLGLL